MKFIDQNENERIQLELRNSLNIENHCPTIDARLPLFYGFVCSNEYIVKHKSIDNSQSSHFTINHDEHSCDIYPNYLIDHAYLFSNDARDLIICTFYRQSIAPLSISNIYITGILAEYLNIERQSFVNYRINFDENISCEKFFMKINSQQSFACITHIESTRDVFEQYHLYWQIILNSQIKNNNE